MSEKKDKDNRQDYPLCVQCQRQMKKYFGNGDIAFPFCNHANCPLFGVLQTGILPAKTLFNRGVVILSPFEDMEEEDLETVTTSANTKDE